MLYHGSRSIFGVLLFKSKQCSCLYCTMCQNTTYQQSDAKINLLLIKCCIVVASLIIFNPLRKAAVLFWQHKHQSKRIRESPTQLYICKNIHTYNAFTEHRVYNTLSGTTIYMYMLQCFREKSTCIPLESE